LINLTRDFEEFLAALADAGADFVLLGGYAVGFYGHARATKDLDVLVRPTVENARKVMDGLRTFGAPVQSLGVAEEDLARYHGVIQFGTEPTRVDILTTASGITYEEARSDAKELEVDGRKIFVIGLGALIKNKRASARGQDILDVEALERLHGTN